MRLNLRIEDFGGVKVKRSPLVPRVPDSTPGLGISEIFFRAHTVRRRRMDFKLCLRTNVWVVAGQALVAAITGEVNRLLSLDLFSLVDGSQLPRRAAMTKFGPLDA
jgi:hypothetical protein